MTRKSVTRSIKRKKSHSVTPSLSTHGSEAGSPAHNRTDRRRREGLGRQRLPATASRLSSQPNLPHHEMGIRIVLTAKSSSQASVRRYTQERSEQCPAKCAISTKAVSYLWAGTLHLSLRCLPSSVPGTSSHSTDTRRCCPRRALCSRHCQDLWEEPPQKCQECPL